MAKKSNNTAMRVLMGAGSVIGFVGGWMILGQGANQSAVSSMQAPTPIVSTVTTTTSGATGQGTSAITNASAATVQPTATTNRSVTQIPTPVSSQATTTNGTATTSRSSRLRTGGS